MKKGERTLLGFASSVYVLLGSTDISFATVMATADTSSSGGTETLMAGALTADIVFTVTANYTLSVSTSGTGAGDASLTFAFGTPGSPELSDTKSISGGTFSNALSHTYDLTLAPFQSVTFDSTGALHADASASPPLGSAVSSVTSGGSQSISTDEPITATFSGSAMYTLALAGAIPPIEIGRAAYDVDAVINDAQTTNGSKTVLQPGSPISISVSPDNPFSSASSGTITASAQAVPEASSMLLLATSIAGFLGCGCLYRRRMV